MIGGLAHGDPGLYALLLIVVLLIGVVGMVMKAIVRGDLLPKSTVDAMHAELLGRVKAQAEALVTLTDTNTELVATNRTQTESIADLADAAHLQVKIGQALHRQLEEA